MSYSSLEAQIRFEASAALPRRLQALEERIEDFDAAIADASGNPDAKEYLQGELGALRDELRRLDRLVAASKSRTSGDNSPAKQLARLHERLDSMSSGRSFNLETQAPSGSTLPPIESFIAPATSSFATSSFRRPGQSFTAAGSNAAAGAGAIASFLYPGIDANEAEDEVSLLAAEGRLAAELSRYPVLASAGSTRSYLFRTLRSWGTADDEQETRRETIAVLELSQAAANLREVYDLLPGEVEAAQAPLDEIEQQMSETRANVDTAVVALGGTSSLAQSLVVPSIGALTLGAVLLASGGCASGGVAVAVAARGLLAAGAAMGATHLGAKGLQKLIHEDLQQMKEQLPKVLSPVPEVEAQLIRDAGHEAVRRLITKLREKDSWKRDYSLRTGILWGKPIRRRPSDVRNGGSAWSTGFSTNLPAATTFKVMQRLSICGSLDPGCKVHWSRPVDGDGSGFVRYLAFSDTLFTRDFFCAGRCAQVEPMGSGTSECYAVALTALNADILERVPGLPVPNKDLDHGTIHISGILVTATSDGQSLIEVMADVDPMVSGVFSSLNVDRSVKWHVVETASRLLKELQVEEKAFSSATS